jgi:hypothetical protein
MAPYCRVLPDRFAPDQSVRQSLAIMTSCPEEKRGGMMPPAVVVSLRRTLGRCDLLASDVSLLSQDFADSSRIDAVVESDVVPKLTTPPTQPNIHSFVERKRCLMQN